MGDNLCYFVGGKYVSLLECYCVSVLMCLMDTRTIQTQTVVFLTESCFTLALQIQYNALCFVV